MTLSRLCQYCIVWKEQVIELLTKSIFPIVYSIHIYNLSAADIIQHEASACYMENNWQFLEISWWHIAHKFSFWVLF